VNDYFWEKLYPPVLSKDGSFDAQQSAWRTTLKYMTGKPVVASIKVAAIYLYTGIGGNCVRFRNGCYTRSLGRLFRQQSRLGFLRPNGRPRIGSEPQELPKVKVGPPTDFVVIVAMTTRDRGASVR
jgi:hypothetical protein